MKAQVFEKKELRNRRFIFEDRSEAGKLLAQMLEPEYGRAEDAIVLAIPSGGVPVGLEISKRLAVPFDLMIVRKIQIPGNTEAGFGAMTLDGSVLLNEELLARLDLTAAQVERQKSLVREELDQRNRLFRKGRTLPDLSGKRVLLVDDGIASGYTMLASIRAAKGRGAFETAVAVPTAPLRTIEKVREHVRRIYCLNIRDTSFFAVADAYRNWYDLEREEVLEMLKQLEPAP